MAAKEIILAIDDDPAVLKFIKVVCHHAAYEYHSADSGAHGLELLEQIKPTAILLDVDMPEMDGLKTHDKIRSDFPKLKVPVIFLSAKKDLATISEATSWGSTYLLKPIDPQRLLAKIETAIHDARAKLASL
jgi:DNA-binding response OmpR family regulator|tara:strand:+ start:1452 stop:1847 length:396 start_codon:yes stop_codon:yes gene_type:complete